MVQLGKHDAGVWVYDFHRADNTASMSATSMLRLWVCCSLDTEPSYGDNPGASPVVGQDRKGLVPAEQGVRMRRLGIRMMFAMAIVVAPIAGVLGTLEPG